MAKTIALMRMRSGCAIDFVSEFNEALSRSLDFEGKHFMPDTLLGDMDDISYNRLRSSATELGTAFEYAATTREQALKAFIADEKLAQSYLYFEMRLHFSKFPLGRNALQKAERGLRNWRKFLNGDSLLLGDTGKDARVMNPAHFLAFCDREDWPLFADGATRAQQLAGIERACCDLWQFRPSIGVDDLVAAALLEPDYGADCLAVLNSLSAQ